MIDHNSPHQVMLFFEQSKSDSQLQKTVSLIEQKQYYEGLKAEGKVALSGDLWKMNRLFVILSVSCDGELEEIISNDPALQQRACELVKIMPFVEV